MKLVNNLFLIFLLIVGISYDVFSQNNIYKEVITVLPDYSVESEVNIIESFHESQNKIDIIYKSYEDLEYNYCEYRNINGYMYSIKKKKTLTTNVRSHSFYSDNQSTSWYVPKSDSVNYSYKIKKPTLLEVGILSFEKNKFDVFSYQVRCPNNMQILYDTSYIENRKLLQISSKDSSGYSVYDFRYVKNQKKELVSNYSKRSIITPEVIRFIITPKAYKNKELEFFSKTYLNLIESSIQINPSTQELIENLCKDCKNVDEASRTLMDFAFDNFNYLSVQDGINSYVPKPPSELIEKRYGDCKSFASFIYASLKHLGYQPALAISSTTDFKMDIDFPSLWSGNHLICVTKTDNQIQYIDATDQQSIYPLPSHHIQGKHILVLDSMPFFHYVQPVQDTLNKVKIDIYLKQENTTLKGNIELKVDTYAAYELLHKFKNDNKSRVLKYLEEYLKGYIGNIKLDSVKYETKSNHVLIKANMLLNLRPVGSHLMLNNTLHHLNNDYIKNYQESHSIYFPHITNIKKQIEIELENTPLIQAEDKALSYPKLKYLYKIDTDIENKKILFKQNLWINDVILKPNEIKEFNTIYNEIKSDGQKNYILCPAPIAQ